MPELEGVELLTSLEEEERAAAGTKLNTLSFILLFCYPPSPQNQRELARGGQSTQCMLLLRSVQL